MDLLCFSSSDWHGVWGSRQQVMLRLAGRGYRVLFVEQSAGLEHFLRYPALRRRRLHHWREGVHQIATNLWIAAPPPLLPGRYYAPSLNGVNQWLLSGWARRVLAHLDLSPTILWLYKPEMGPLIGRFGESLSVYHCIDEAAAGTTGRKRQVIERLEADLLRRVDLVFANSLPIYENKRRLHPHTYRIPSGADVAHFAQAQKRDRPEHPAIAGLPRPRVGYLGNINERLDYDALAHLAASCPNWSLVFIGDSYPWTMAAPPLRRLAAFSNVHFLGSYPFAEVPALLRGLDVCLLPYVSDERAYYRSPLKLYEYLAAGKPVVATPHPEAAELGDAVYQASNPTALVTAVVQALAEDDEMRQQQRLLLAGQHSWDGRVDMMEQHIQAALRRQGNDR